jgi:hydrogenase maturation protein HypF
MSNSLQRLSIKLSGLVQGVGFRPFVYRLAMETGLTGWVANTPEGASIEVEGHPETLQSFVKRLNAELPFPGRIETLNIYTLPPVNFTAFTVKHSATIGRPSAFILPDIAVCKDCIQDISDPSNRRYRYPFTSCTHCGPRWSIVESLPFDRERTAMAIFELCPTCLSEYQDPADRRFHAQTTCCPACGPLLMLWDRGGNEETIGDEALRATVKRLHEGAIVALKGIGGFQLLVDASNTEAVARLRLRKARPTKPFALMCSSLDEASGLCDISRLERDWLLSPEAPIVLLHRAVSSDIPIARNVAPNNPYLGVMLPYSPLHYLLLSDFGRPLVATSGNLSGEPICVDECEVLEHLGGIADWFLIHDRSVFRSLDDSVIRVVAGQELVLRRARGYPPMVKLSQPLPPTLAVGAHLKNTVAMAAGYQALISQHLGDLNTPSARMNFRQTISEIETIFGIHPEQIVADQHPDYMTSHYAEAFGKPLIRVQHHYAHVLSCMAEHELSPPLLGIAWDGLGLGSDGTLWGGEFLKMVSAGFERTASFRPFPLPGGEKASREPRRSALGLLYESLGEAALERNDLAPIQAFLETERHTLAQMLGRGLNTPYCSSVGRLFDAVASLLDLRQISGFEGDAAMAVEFAAEPLVTTEYYPFSLKEVSTATAPRYLVDWEPMLLSLLDDLPHGKLAEIAAKFHRTLAEIAYSVAMNIGIQQIVLSGGAFQNRLLTEIVLARLEPAGFTVFRHRRIPPNDGGLSLGQLLATMTTR